MVCILEQKRNKLKETTTWTRHRVVFKPWQEVVELKKAKKMYLQEASQLKEKREKRQDVAARTVSNRKQACEDDSSLPYSTFQTSS